MTNFPLNSEAVAAFKDLKDDLVDACLNSTNEKIPFTVETDASNSTLSASLSQDGRPWASFSRTLQGTEINQSSVEKETQAIMEAVNKWRHHWKTLHPGQRSVSYMFNPQNASKVKNNKILHWRVELSEFNCEIIYRPGIENVVADTLTRAHCDSTNPTSLWYSFFVALW